MTSIRHPQFRWRRSFVRSPYPDLILTLLQIVIKEFMFM